MIDFSSYDIEEGFVLSQRQAIEYLEQVASECVSQAIDNPNELDYENASEKIKDIMLMGRRIIGEDWAWVKFSECPMSASEIMITQMEEKE